MYDDELKQNKPTRSKAEAILAGCGALGRRPPKKLGDGGVRAEWRGNHWRVWLQDGWIDLSDELTVVGVSEELTLVEEA